MSDHGITIDIYKQRVIELFRSGKATEDQWQEMAVAVLYAAENRDECPAIESEVNPQTCDPYDGNWPK